MSRRGTQGIFAGQTDAEVLDQLLRTLTNQCMDDAGGYTCDEAETVAGAWAYIGETTIAEAFLAAHAMEDDEGDDHYGDAKGVQVEWGGELGPIVTTPEKEQT